MEADALLGLAAAAAAIDLELHLALPSASPRPPPRSSTQPKIGGPKAIGFGLELFTGAAEFFAHQRGSGRVKPEGSTSSPRDAPPPLLDVADLGMPPTPRNQDSEPKSKRVKTEQPTTSSGGADDAVPSPVKPLLTVQFPQAARRARRSRRRRASPYPPVAAAAYNNRVLDSCDTVPAWVRAEILPRHDLPGDLVLHYVGEKVLRHSDMNSRQARFLLPTAAAVRLRAFLSADEIAACGFDSADRKAKKGEDGARAKGTSYDGVPVSVYVSGGAGWGVSELRLNKFHRSNGTVINGKGYRPFIWRCGLVDGDGVEFWAFRRPAHGLCFLITKRNDVCPLDCKGRTRS